MDDKIQTGIVNKKIYFESGSICFESRFTSLEQKNYQPRGNADPSRFKKKTHQYRTFTYTPMSTVYKENEDFVFEESFIL